MSAEITPAILLSFSCSSTAAGMRDYRERRAARRVRCAVLLPIQSLLHTDRHHLERSGSVLRALSESSVYPHGSPFLGATRTSMLQAVKSGNRSRCFLIPRNLNESCSTPTCYPLVPQSLLARSYLVESHSAKVCFKAKSTGFFSQRTEQSYITRLPRQDEFAAKGPILPTSRSFWKSLMAFCSPSSIPYTYFWPKFQLLVLLKFIYYCAQP
ncbi:hypothetical protein BDP55DRAFT_162712 [Colletotrichum godetiae]|uniref:Uncharacterized protein n=1 Tax=Colletotrichum godetiae TaxID=1209918 RepID=A0AAJ0ALB1_9PEZI|nr:uncharacterized protein BDP55DRAFT_162712 [Colletotrichum godetiae]KAK1675329.1 hypothetical protein BDP55DRAFT_162712 [Colletotrichum godetiae]